MKVLLIFDWGGTVMVDYDKEGPMCFWEKVDYVSGMKTALLKLSKKYSCCIATNADMSDTEAMIKALNRINADKYFKNFFSSKDLDYEKPDKRFFLNITKEMDVMPVDCVMIGNSYAKDIKGAKDAGMKTIFYNEDDISGNFSDADIVISSMDKLYKSVEQIIDSA